MATPEPPPSDDSDVNVRFRRALQPRQNACDDQDTEQASGTDDGAGRYRKLLRSSRGLGNRLHADLELSDTEGSVSPASAGKRRKGLGDSPPSPAHQQSDDYALNTEDSEDDTGSVRGAPETAVVPASGKPQSPDTLRASSQTVKVGGRRASGTLSPRQVINDDSDDDGRRGVAGANAAGGQYGFAKRAAGGAPAASGAADRKSGAEGARRSSGAAAVATGSTASVSSSITTVGLSDEIKELLAYVGRYRPQDIDLEPELKPFIPDYIPAVGDIDAFIKIPRPDGKLDTLGLTTVDEPSGKQSDPTVLDLQLRILSKTSTAGPMTVHSIDGETMKSRKGEARLDQWLKNIRNLHESKPPPSVHFGRRMPDVEELMQEWPKEIEAIWGHVPPPSAELNLSLAAYVRLICVLLDIPVPAAAEGSGGSSSNANPATSGPNKKVGRGLIESLYMLFTLYAEFKNSQHFVKSVEGWWPVNAELAGSDAGGSGWGGGDGGGMGGSQESGIQGSVISEY